MPVPIASVRGHIYRVRPTGIVDIDHETGNTTQYSATSGADISVSALAALNGSNYGLRVLIDDITADTASKTGLNNTSGKVRGRFYLDPNSITMGNGEYITICRLNNQATANLMVVNLAYATVGGWQLVVGMYLDNASWANSANINISDAPHWIEFDFRRASSNVASDGSLSWWIDGNPQTAITGRDNYDAFPNFDYVRFGAVTGSYATASGSFYIDDIVFNDTGDPIGA